MMVTWKMMWWMEAAWMDLATCRATLINKYTCDANVMYQHYIAVHVHYDVVTDWSYALARFLLSMLFGVSTVSSHACRSTDKVR